MARPLRIEFQGAIYHVTARGNRREAIFADDGDRRAFLAVLDATVERFGWLCHAYCLMTNHYHLLIETPAPNLGRGMRQLNGVYTQRFNRRNGAVGHVFQGRYKAIVVEKDAHLLELARYVVLNPVRAGLVDDAAAWPWSSYRPTLGDRPPPRFLHTAWLLEQFANTPEEARRAYRRFVADGVGADSPWAKRPRPDVLGGESFVAAIAERWAGRVDPEIPRSRRLDARPSLDALRAAHTERGAWMAAAVRDHGYRLTDIAEAAGLHYSSVSKIIKAWEMASVSKFKT